jgi:hypothetical protein
MVAALIGMIVPSTPTQVQDANTEVGIEQMGSSGCIALPAACPLGHKAQRCSDALGDVHGAIHVGRHRRAPLTQRGSIETAGIGDQAVACGIAG